MIDWISLEDRIVRSIHKYQALPDGLIHKETSSFNHIFIYKFGNQLQLYTSDLKYPIDTPVLSGVMSRIDITKPFDLLAWYSRAMILSTAWLQEKNTIYLLGFGGGRIPMILLRYFPTISIESTEIDLQIIKLSKEYFGITDDQRLQIINEDGGNYLQRQSSKKYDVIMLDCFTGSGLHPLRFANKSFYSKCKKKITTSGVICTNIHETDTEFRKKYNEFIESFQYTLEARNTGSCVLFGWNDGSITFEKIKKRIVTIEREKKWSLGLSSIIQSCFVLRRGC